MDNDINKEKNIENKNNDNSKLKIENHNGNIYKTIL